MLTPEAAASLPPLKYIKNAEREVAKNVSAVRAVCPTQCVPCIRLLQWETNSNRLPETETHNKNGEYQARSSIV